MTKKIKLEEGRKITKKPKLPPVKKGANITQKPKLPKNGQGKKQQ